MNLALVRLFWFDIYTTSATGCEFTKKYLIKLIPERLHELNVDSDHSIMDFSMMVGKEVYGEDTEECADFLLNVGKSC